MAKFFRVFLTDWSINIALCTMVNFFKKSIFFYTVGWAERERGPP